MTIEGLTNLFINGLIAIVLGVAGYIASSIVAQCIRILAQRFFDRGAVGFLASLGRVAVLMLTLKLIVDQTGASGVLVVLITALTGAFALGSERIAGDMVAGFNLFILRYYKAGDLVTIGNHHGRIGGISLTHTSLDNGDRDRIIIPNSDILGNIIVNHTAVPGVRLKAKITIAIPHDRDVVVEQILAAARTFEPQMRGPNDAPSVLLVEATPSGSTYLARVFAPESMYGEDAALLLHIRRVLEQQEATTADEGTSDAPSTAVTHLQQGTLLRDVANPVF